MKKFILIILTLIFLVGCTQLPLSEETGLGPTEYRGKTSTEEIKNENENLKDALNKTKTELEELEKDYLSLAKSNEKIIFKLQEAESKLKIVESKDIPEFNIESTDKNSIITYLKDSSNLIDNSIKGIEFISTDEEVVFRTLGYGRNFSQIFIWDEEMSEPELIEGAILDKEGSFEWLGKYLLIKNSDKNKILDIKNKKISGSFDTAQKMQLLDETTTLLLQYNDKFVLYDFINDSNKPIELDNNNYSDFKLQNDSIIFSGEYMDNSIKYEIRAVISIEELKEIYEIKGIDGLEIVEDGVTDAESIESTNNAGTAGETI